MTPEFKFNIEIRNKQALKQAYMSFVQNGGLFITLPKNLPLNTIIQIDLRLMNETEGTPVIAQIVWLTPQKEQQLTQDVRVGVHFIGDNAGTIRTKIETFLLGML